MSDAVPSWTWDDYRIVDDRPSAADGYLYADGMPFAVLLTWFAGPSHVLRSRELQPRGDTRHEVEDADGTVRRWSQPWTDADEADLDNIWDEDLAELGVDPRPRGTDWYLHVPGVAHVLRLFDAAERDLPWPMRDEDVAPFIARTGEIVRERYEPIPDGVGTLPRPQPWLLEGPALG